MPQIYDPFFDVKQPDYKKIPNPNDPDDKSLCIVIQDGSAFDGAVIKYTTFKLADEVNDDETVNCTYEYDIEVPPNQEEISDEEGVQFEKRLGEWVLDMLQTQLERDATKNRKSDSTESNT